MKRYKIYHSARFDRELAKFDLDFHNKLNGIEDQLVETPYVGDPLNAKWFREKRIGSFRVYYLIYEDLESVFMVAISGKKDQQRVINTIRLLFDYFREELKNLIDEE